MLQEYKDAVLAMLTEKTPASRAAVLKAAHGLRNHPSPLVQDHIMSLVAYIRHPKPANADRFADTLLAIG